MIWFYWGSGLLLALMWSVAVFQAAIHRSSIVDITTPEFDTPANILLPSLTVVVPARNEEAEIEEALRSLLRLDLPGYEVIAVNDRSSDRTGEIMERIASESRAADSKPSTGVLRVMHVRDLPSGWLGKTHAMWLGAQQGIGDWILFTDADCVFHPASLRRALGYAIKNHVDHLVLFPTAHLETWGERMMISFPHVMSNFAMHRHWKIRDPKARDHIGAGAFNLIRRPAYVEIGTFEKLRLEVVDDLKLGEAVKKAGFQQDVVFGKDMVRLRWGAGAAGIIANLEKNLFAVLRFRLSMALLVCCSLLFVAVWPFVGLAVAPGWSRSGFAVAVAMIAAAYYGTSGYTGLSPLLFLACPLSALLFVFATLRSTFVAMRDGAITWRGTKYSLAELRRNS
jgi:glycosyltransferase involved in cell wall biosynthesis